MIGFLWYIYIVPHTGGLVNPPCATFSTGTLSPLRWVVGTGHVGKRRLHSHDAATQVAFIMVIVFTLTANRHTLLSYFHRSE